MKDPMFYILAPFALAFGLFVVFLIVGVLIGDPGRPFRMFASRPLPEPNENEERNVAPEANGSTKNPNNGKDT